MSMEMASERVCYVHCNFCNTILAVSVPCSSMLTMVTVRCGHCGNLLSVNMAPATSLQSASPPLDLIQRQYLTRSEDMGSKRSTTTIGSSSSSSSSSSTKNIAASFESAEHDPPRTPPIRPPEKKQRVPSAYNKFIKEEIQRIKANNPEISHREAFSLAAKNWAHFPRIHFGLNLEGQKQANKLDQTITGGEGAHQKSPGFY